MQVFFRTRRVLFSLPWLLAPSAAWSHAMPTYIAEDQAWRLWPDGVVAYELVEHPTGNQDRSPLPQLPIDSAARQAVEQAMRHLQQKTGGAVLFVASNDHPRRVRISLMPNNPDVGYCGMASVGHMPAIGTLQIADRAECKTRAVALHELMHTLGFLHENQRFQAIMDRERRPAAQAFYADRSTTVDHDSITYNDGIQGERLDLLSAPADVLMVRLRHGTDATGRWFQELSTQDVASIQRYYHPDRTLAKQLERAKQERPQLTFVRFELASGQCLQTGSPKPPENWRELFTSRCDQVSASQRWAQDEQGALHSLAYPGYCVAKRAQTGQADRQGDFAILEPCRPGDQLQQWTRQQPVLSNRAQPQLALSYDPVRRNVLAWERHEELQADWRQRAAPVARPPSTVPQGNDGPDPWRHALHSMRHAAQQVYRLKINGLCLSDAGHDRRLLDHDEHMAQLQPCQAGPAQLWILDRGRLASLQHPGYCLGNTGLHRPTEDDRPAYVGLQRCRAGRPSQQWTLQGIQGAPTVNITTRLNPLVANDYRLLEARPDGLLHFGTAASPQNRVAWLASAENLPGARPTVIEQAKESVRQVGMLPKPSGRLIRLLGGDLPAPATPARCLSAQTTAPAGFAADERGLELARCDASVAAQRWEMHDDGRITTPASPGLCLGRNQARLGQELHGSYRQRAYRYTGHAALQPCRSDAPTQQWAWRATRYHHQDETAGNSGAQLVLRNAPDLSLIVHGKTRGPQLSIGQPDIADHFQFFRWQPTRPAGPLPAAIGGVRPLDWAEPGANWLHPGPGYAGRGVNMAGRQTYRPLLWHHSRQCLSLRPDGNWRLTLAACRVGEKEQNWRIDEQYRLVNQRYPALCLRRADKGAVLDACDSGQSLPHWFLNDSAQLDSLDMSPLRLIPGRQGDIVLDGKTYQGFLVGWRWG